MLAYFDCFSGISGDMVLGALADAGWPLAGLQAVVSALGLVDACRVQAAEVRRGSLRATRVQVEVTGVPSDVRHLSDVLLLIEGSELSPPVKARSGEVFRNLASAEARVHGISLEEVHFHEVGAVDAIVDVVGAVAGLAALGVEAVYASPLPLGQGAIRSEHGTLPLPAPATLELLAMARAPTRPAEAGVELVTPTGAAILATLAEFRQPAMTLERVGVGAGGRDDLPWPNVLRLWLGRALEPESGAHVLIETNIDDMVPEAYGHVMEQLFAAGALDVFFTPIYMKKNRPATLLGVIARAGDEAMLAQLLLRETTTLGVRVQPLRRYEAGREVRTVETSFGPVRVKVKLLEGRAVGVAPEYEDCHRLAAEQRVPFTVVYAEAMRASGALIEGLLPRADGVENEARP